MASGNQNDAPNLSQLGHHINDQRQRVNKANFNAKKHNKSRKTSSKSNDKAVYKKHVNGDAKENTTESVSSDSLAKSVRSNYSEPTTGVSQRHQQEWSKPIDNNCDNLSNTTTGRTQKLELNHDDSGFACSLVTSSLRDDVDLRSARRLELSVLDDVQGSPRHSRANDQLNLVDTGRSKLNNFHAGEKNEYRKVDQRRFVAESDNEKWSSHHKFDNRGGASDNKMFYSKKRPVEESDRGAGISTRREGHSNFYNKDCRNQTYRASANWAHEPKTYDNNPNKRFNNVSLDNDNKTDNNRTPRNQHRDVEKKHDKYSNAACFSSTTSETQEVKKSTLKGVLFPSGSVKESRRGDSAKYNHSNHQIRCVANNKNDNTERNNSVKAISISEDSVQLSDNGRSSGTVKQVFPLTTSNFTDESQRGSLIDQLYSDTYECMVCCGVVRKDTAVWGCQNCYHMFHLYCIKKWASTPTALLVTNAVAGWRCPACQNVCQKNPTQYLCFCGKLKDPPYSRQCTPHSCGELCGKTRSEDCAHRCNILCHPGPCPPCEARVTRSCLCGKENKSVRCSDGTQYRCSSVCDKKRNCGKHTCDVVCHAGRCNPCAEIIVQSCSCSSMTRSVVCGSVESSSDSFSCEKICGKKLACGNHYCTIVCHSGSCGTCALLPSALLLCACGQTNITDIKKAVPRISCTDKQTTCRRVCDKLLKCGNPARPHRCKHKCHIDACPPCDGVTQVDCRCGALSQTMSCVEALSFISPIDSTESTMTSIYCCTRRCNKKMSCGRHKCAQLCCTSTDHICKLICGYKLSCDLHKCEEMCHRGNCSTCWHVSFDELFCYCGAEVIYPPVPCGTKPPDCLRPCQRVHDCSHEVLHTCHSEEQCPQCTVLTSKQCMGGHELRHNIPCYLKNISCGRPCNKLLPCQQHKCLLVCHKDECLDMNESCVQLCPLERPACGHACLEMCHRGLPCPNTPCKTAVVLSCECGVRHEKSICRQINVHIEGKTADGVKSADLQADVRSDVGNSERSVRRSQKLPCNAECAKYQRKQRLTLRLQIKNPNLSDKLRIPSYSQFLKDFVKQNTAFVVQIEEDLSQLVISANQRKSQTTRTHAFKCMPYAQRRTIHELAEFYGCTTESFDEEPNKNVVATAVRDKCWLPNIKLTHFLQRKFVAKTSVPIQPNYEYIWSEAETALLNSNPERVTSVVTNNDANPSDVNISPSIESFNQCEIESVD